MLLVLVTVTISERDRLRSGEYFDWRRPVDGTATQTGVMLKLNSYARAIRDKSHFCFQFTQN